MHTVEDKGCAHCGDDGCVLFFSSVVFFEFFFLFRFMSESAERIDDGDLSSSSSEEDNELLSSLSQSLILLRGVKDPWVFGTKSRKEAADLIREVSAKLLRFTKQRGPEVDPLKWLDDCTDLQHVPPLPKNSPLFLMSGPKPDGEAATKYRSALDKCIEDHGWVSNSFVFAP